MVLKTCNFFHDINSSGRKQNFEEKYSAMFWQNQTTTKIMFLRILTLLSFVIVQQETTKSTSFSFALYLSTVLTIIVSTCLLVSNFI